MLSDNEQLHNLPEVGKLYRLCVKRGGKRPFSAYGLDLERNLLVGIPPTIRDGMGPVQSFLVSGTGEVFRWCHLSNKDMLLRVAVKAQLYSSNFLAWLEEVICDVE
jgi:hypothetical protein